MLSKAEIQYLQGQKNISKSYERKLKCLIKKKIDVLRKEIPLLSKLLLDNSGMCEDIMYRIKEVGKLNSFDKQTSSNELHQQMTENQATKYSNVNPEILKPDNKTIVVALDSIKGSTISQTEDEGATKISNWKSNEIMMDASKDIESQNFD